MLPGVLLFVSFSTVMLFKFLYILSIIIIIKVPEVPKNVPDEKIPVVEPKKTVVPPAKGTMTKLTESKPSLFYCFNTREDNTQDLC